MFQSGQRAFGSEISNPRRSIDQSCLRTSGKRGFGAPSRPLTWGQRLIFPRSRARHLVASIALRCVRQPIRSGKGEGREASAPRDVVGVTNLSTCPFASTGGVAQSRVPPHERNIQNNLGKHTGGCTYLAQKADGHGADGIHRRAPF